MLRLKACPRCHGDLLITMSIEEPSATCLQCGHTSAIAPAGPGHVASTRPMRIPASSRSHAPRAA